MALSIVNMQYVRFNEVIATKGVYSHISGKDQANGLLFAEVVETISLDAGECRVEIQIES